MTRSKTEQDEIDRTGRDEQVAGRDIRDEPQPDAEAPFGTPGAPSEEPPEGLENSFA